MLINLSILVCELNNESVITALVDPRREPTDVNDATRNFSEKNSHKVTPELIDHGELRAAHKHERLKDVNLKNLKTLTVHQVCT